MSGIQTQPVTEPKRHGPEADSLPARPTSPLSEAESRPLGGRRLPDLLAPAGDWECAKAAVENGADGIYFGLERFNARMRANNFTAADLPKLMDFLHRRGVKGSVTFNTLVFENEMAQAEDYVRAMIAAGVDAAVVQDVGICRLIRRISPDFPIHVSTQMTVTSAAGVEFARGLGCNLVVLARECSLKEIAAIAARGQGQGTKDEGRRSKVEEGEPAANGCCPLSPAGRSASLPLEVFVHGALCVAYSGQCLTSEALGGRSANRGECAQACRLPYDLFADGKQVPLGDRKYLLSPQDLAGLSVLPDLVRAGVASLKIEGRLKSPEYAANITRIYRNALDALGQEPGTTKQEPRTTDPQYEMEMAFSRGLYTGWFHGSNNRELVHAHFGKKRGVYLGQVVAVEREGVLVRLEGRLKPGDGVVFDAGRPEEKEEGGRVYEIKPGPESRRLRGSPGRGQENGGANRRPVSSPADAGETPALLCFGRGDIDFRRVRAGDKVWKTSDPELERHIRQSYAGDAPKFQRAMMVEAHGLAGAPLTLIARDELGHTVRVDSVMPLVRAEKQPLTTERLREQLGRLGGTPFKLGEFKNCLAGEVLLPVSELNRLRREMVRELETLRARPRRWTIECGMRSAECGVKEVSRGVGISLRSTDGNGDNAASMASPQLIVLVRNLSQLEAAMKCGVATLYCEFEDPRKYREAVSHFRQSALRVPHSALYAAPPRIFKLGEDWILEQVRSCEADGYLVRNYDHLNWFAGARCIGDYSLNIANGLAADYFKNQFGLERVTASYDLNFAQLEALLQAAPPEWFEVTIHQHIPMFHMEHCVFCAFLSKGTDYRDCGRPCDQREVKLRDRAGAQHPVKADAGCRNTVFNALAQTGADYAARMLALGVRAFRLEFLTETAAQVEQSIGRYRQLLRGEITGPQLWRELKLLNQLGVTRGQIAG